MAKVIPFQVVGGTDTEAASGGNTSPSFAGPGGGASGAWASALPRLHYPYSPQQTSTEGPPFFAALSAGGGSGADHISEGTKAMTDVTREEMLAKLEATESRLDAKLAGITAELRVLSTQVTTSIEGIRAAQKASERAEDQATKAKDAAIGTRWNIIFTALASVAIVVSLIFGVYAAIWQTVSAVREPPIPREATSPQQP